MSAIPQSSRALSERILAPLRQVAWRNRVALVSKGVLQTLAVSLTVWLGAVLLTGFLPGMHWLLRDLLSGVAWVTLLGSAIYFLRPAVRRRNLSRVARQVEDSQADREELLSSAVELSTNVDPRFAGSPELVAHLVKQAEEAAKAVRPRAVVSYRAVARWGAIAAPVMLAWAVLLPLWPTPMLRGLYHVMVPWRNALPAALVDVTVKPGDVTLAEGDTLEITATVAGRAAFNSEVRSASLLLRYPSGQTSTLDMWPGGPRSFRFAIEHVPSPLDYSITTSEGTSAWFHVTVLPRPAVAGIGVRYAYPKYTRLAVKTDSRPDGAVDAVIGTRAQLTIHSTQPLDPKSRIIVTDEGQDGVEHAIALAHGAGNDYLATLVLARNESYRIELIGENHLAGIDSKPHPITARPDEPPTIRIMSPAARMNLPQDDTVPIVFRASDDFGVAKVEAIVQVDEQSPEIFNVALPVRGARQAEGAWKLSIPYLLVRHNLTHANRVVYQFRATDTHEPDAQFALTPRQIIDIDHSYKESFDAKKEAQSAKNLIEAIKQAIKELSDESTALEPLAKTKTDRVLSVIEKRAAGALKDSVVTTGKSLSAAADTNLDGPLADLAIAANAVVNGPVFGAAEDVATAVLNAADSAARQKSLVSASDKLAVAKKRLEALLAKAEKQAKTEEVARTLEDMAKHEMQLAKALEQKQAAKNTDRNREAQDQAQFRQRLDEVLNKNQELNNPQAREMAQKHQQLIQKVEQLEQQQKQLEPLPAKQQAVNDAQARANDFAKQQAALNKEIADFAKKDQPQVKEASAQVPAQPQLENIVKGLEDPNRVPQANAEQRQAASQLKTAAQQLTSAAKENGPAAQAQQRDKQDADRAAKAAEQAKDIGKQIDAAKADEGAKKDPNRARDLANQIKQSEQQLAGQLEQQANDMKARDPGQKDAIDAAKQEIAEARQQADANNGDAGQAAQADAKLADAAEKLQAAAGEAEAQAGEDRKELAAAGEKAEGLAQQQKELADATSKAAEALAHARQQQGNDQALQQGEQQATQQTAQAAGEADQLKQQEQQSSPEMGKRAATAKVALKEAEAHEQKAASAAQKKDAATAGKEQQAAAKALARAEQALRGLPDAADAVAQADPAGGDPNGDPNGGDPNGGDPSGNGDPNTPAGDAPGDKPDANTGGKEAMAKGDAAGNKPDAAPDGEKPDTAGGEKGDPAQGGEKGGPAQGAEAADKPAGDDAAAGNDAKPGAGAAQPGAPKPSGKAAARPRTPASPQQLMRQAAAEVQAARQAQDEAANTQRPAAARQAAEALAQAAADLHQSLHPDAGQVASNAGQPEPGTPSHQPGSDPTAGGPGSESAHEPGTDPASGEGRPPGMNPNSLTKDGHGIDVTSIARADVRPDAIRQMGVSASDWAKLPPMTKQDLLNAARAGGPPEYQQMIKNYFVRIAKLEAEGREPKR